MKDSTKKAMREAVQRIIKRIPRGSIFDSNHVIDGLKEKYPDEYLNFINEVETKNPKNKAISAQKLIEKEIRAFSETGFILIEFPKSPSTKRKI